MKRLTKRLNDGKELCIEVCGEKCVDGYTWCPKCKPFTNVMKKLADYEDAEEHGLLYRKIFFIENYCHKPSDCPLICEYCSDNYLEVKDIVVEINSIHIYGEIGKTVFLTKEEAKQALQQIHEEE